jgi:hypothetical protein
MFSRALLSPPSPHGSSKLHRCWALPLLEGYLALNFPLFFLIKFSTKAYKFTAILERSRMAFIFHLFVKYFLEGLLVHVEFFRKIFNPFNVVSENVLKYFCLFLV